jgi:hypothetical protein
VKFKGSQSLALVSKALEFMGFKRTTERKRRVSFRLGRYHVKLTHQRERRLILDIHMDVGYWPGIQFHHRAVQPREQVVKEFLRDLNEARKRLGFKGIWRWERVR